jgi:hypothetical protein
MSVTFKTLPAGLLAAILFLEPSGAFADRKDGEKQRRAKWEDRDRDRDYAYGRDRGDYRYGRDGWGGVRERTESDKEWRKEQKERDKEAREA